MNKPYRCGLVVGKFCPLHRGHELVIERALTLCDQVIVISYTKPVFDGCGRETREKWFEELFPTVTRLVIDDESIESLCAAQRIATTPTIPHNMAPDHEHREFVGWLCWSLLRQTVDAVLSSEDYGDGFAEFLTHYFQARTHTASAVRHICVDKARAAIPISGTAIRSNPHDYREFLSPAVYASFVKRVCILGGESSGKTTLARRLAEHADTCWAPEYGRELWDQKNGALQFEDMIRIAAIQVEREAALSKQARQWLFCDTSPLTTLFYCLEMFAKTEPQLEELATRPYDHVFLCAPDFPFVQDGTRRDESFRVRQHQWYLNELAKRKINFTLVTGSVENRIDAVMFHLQKNANQDR